MQLVLTALQLATQNSQQSFTLLPCHVTLSNKFLLLFVFQVPCVGVSIGIERIFSILEAKAEVTINLFVIYFSPVSGICHFSYVGILDP